MSDRYVHVVAPYRASLRDAGLCFTGCGDAATRHGLCTHCAETNYLRRQIHRRRHAQGTQRCRACGERGHSRRTCATLPNCPNHPPGQIRKATLAFGTRSYCAPCYRMLSTPLTLEIG